MDTRPIRNKLENALISHYGDDSSQTNRIKSLSGPELEKEFKHVFDIKSEVNYLT